MQIAEQQPINWHRRGFDLWWGLSISLRRAMLQKVSADLASKQTSMINDPWKFRRYVIVPAIEVGYEN